MASTNNYGYDALGNLVRDDVERIDGILWTVAGKVKGVSHTPASGEPDLSFAYGANGQRIMKQVGDPANGGYREHYIRDAQGNIMATYRFNPASLVLNDRPIYGSSRLGNYTKDLQLYNYLPGGQPPLAIQQGELNYELTDHLGNVSAVVTGHLITNLLGITPCQAQLVSAQGYEPGGSLLPGGNYSSSTYAYGFNGMRKDDEIHGATGTSYDFGARLYDPRVGRWLSLDPLRTKYPDLSPYAFANNDPILFIDEGGKIFKIYFETINAKTGKPQVSTVDFDGTKAIAADGTEYVMGSNQFVDDVIASYRYVVDNGADPRSMLQTIATSSIVINVEKIDDSDDESVRKSNTIRWDPKAGFHIVVKEKKEILVDGYQSAAIGFVNEAADAYLDEFMTKEQQKAEEIKSQENRDQWGIDRENEAIDGLVGKGFKETKRGNEGTRGKDEFCYPCTDAEMTGPTSTTPKDQ